MARLQILQLPEGAGDERPPFILVVDDVPRDEAGFEALRRDLYSDGDLVDRIGARAVMVFEEHVEIPANAAPPVAAYGAEERAGTTEGQLRAEALAAEARAELTRSENVRDELRAQRDEARQWARHGYEIGQRHCGWTDHGVAPEWLTLDWPPDFGVCDHLKRAVGYDEALTRVRALPVEPEYMDALHPDPSGYRHGYRVATEAAQRAARVQQPEATEGGG